MFSSIQKVAVVFLLIHSSYARAETTVALTTVHANATTEEKTLIQGLLPLLEVAVGEEEGLQVVEREAVAAMVAELARNLAVCHRGGECPLCSPFDEDLVSHSTFPSRISKTACSKTMASEGRLLLLS